MSRIFACLIALLLAFGPVAARADDAVSAGTRLDAAAVPAQAAAPAETGLWGMAPGEALTVGVGILAGVVAMDVLVGSAPALIAGAVAGAMIGSWWFDSYGPTLKPITGGLKGNTI